ncbi:AAA family ATPase [Staphylococcus schweitzeri]|uniref:AAA family ATPase n=1 Tax=Staphylococcus schweitzeri TaxID=1654388 RepID=UPI0039F0BA5A
MGNKFIKIVTGDINQFYEEKKGNFFINFLDVIENLKSLFNGDESILNASLGLSKDFIINEGSVKRLTSSFESELGMLIKPLKEEGFLERIYIINPTVTLNESIKKLYPENVDEIKYSFYSYKNDDIIKSYKITNSEIRGQEKAIKKIHSSLINHNNSNKTKVFLLYGPAGVGKTESIKSIAKILFGDDKLKRIQLSMQNDTEGYNYIFGNNKHKKSLSEDILNRKSNFILLDEFDKCPANTYNAFYQMFDENIFKDNHFQIDLSGTIIFCTTNFKDKINIKNILGSALYSRIDVFVKYETIDEKIKYEYLEKLYHKLISKYDESTKETLLSSGLLKVLLKQDINKLSMREIDSMTIESINRYLFNCLLEKELYPQIHE